MQENIRNIAIVAHVDHGKTTLVDKLLQQSDSYASRSDMPDRVMDSQDLEKERGITILAKNTAITWRGTRINIVDTPGHADFGGEVERVLSMVDSVLLLVDAVDGPMPQTRFVTAKAFAQGLAPIVVINKVDRDGARPHAVLDEVFDLFDNLGATDEQLDFPVIYASGLRGVAGPEPDALGADLEFLLQSIVDQVPPPAVDETAPFQMQISSLDYSSYVGVIGIGRVTRGVAKPGQAIVAVAADGSRRNARILEVLGYDGLERGAVDAASAGDIVCVTGVEGIGISDTLCDPAAVEPLPRLVVDEPTVQMAFRVNTSPFAGKDGKYLTSRQIRERLLRETLHNVALRVEDTENPDVFRVAGRGELHLSVLIETMRREGYELAVGKPEVVLHEGDDGPEEPYENLVVDIPDDAQGAIMEELGRRKGELTNMLPDGRGRVRLDYTVPARGLIGFRTQFLTLTAGAGLMSHVFSHYGPYQPGDLGSRQNGVLVSNVAGKITGYSLFNLQARGRMLVKENTETYEGMVIGIHSRDNDLPVNPTKEKKLTNVRAAGSDENIILTPPIQFSLEQALEFIDDDELVEVTPTAIRIRKKHLKEHERKRARKDKDVASA